MDFNLQLISMLNLLLITAGACILYHIEYADNGLQKMQSLPVRESGLFIGKCGILLPFVLMMLLFETASLCFCGWHWLDAGKEELIEMLQTLGFTLLLTLPAAVIALVIASACRNMWTTLGIGILCIFTATMLPTDNFIISLFPYVLPFQILPGMETARGDPLLYCRRVQDCRGMRRRVYLLKSQEVICMNIFTLTAVEFKKIKRSKILLILIAATVILWLPNILNADLNFDMSDIGISPENSFFIQGFMGMAWFIYPAVMVVTTVILVQTERTNHGILQDARPSGQHAAFVPCQIHCPGSDRSSIYPVYDCRILYRRSCRRSAE